MLYIFLSSSSPLMLVAVAKEKWTSSHTLLSLVLPPPSKSEKKNYVQFNFFLALSAYAMDTHNFSSHPLWSLRFIYANFLSYLPPRVESLSPFHINLFSPPRNCRCWIQISKTENFDAFSPASHLIYPLQDSFSAQF